MKKLSVTIIALDEAQRIAATLRAVSPVADEIILVDAGSQDDTVTLAEAEGATVIQNEFKGFGQQKRFAEDQCQYDWILNIDADEVLSGQLVDEIADWKTRPNVASACYEIEILNIYPGDQNPRPLARDYRVVRLYDRQRMRYRDHALFDRVEVPDGANVGRFKAPIHHHPFLSFEHMVMKANRLTTIQAQEAKRKSRVVLLIRLVIEYPLTLLKVYLLRLHFLGGWKGLAFSHVTAMSRLLRIIKMLERGDD
ncbi:MAG: glycosyltransferase family 2 protein [Ahrensia sp.]|nr:glycosyltransferase family 2 protein [Ahrensia sp.]